MGTGKTTVGKEVAKQLRRSFVEMDDEIEKQEKSPVTDIFKTKGEKYFRECETALLERLSRKNDLVVSCGGGVILNPQNRDIINTTGVSICLTADPKVIHERVRDTAHRPLLNVQDPLERIKTLLKEREPLYRQADFSVDTSAMTKKQVVNAVLSMIRKEG